MIYLDYAAATPVSTEVMEVMRPYLSTHFANPASMHLAGSKVKDEIEKARSKVASILSRKSDKILFFSSGTHSINLAIQGVMRKNDHVITSSIEHKAVLETCTRFSHTIAGVSSKGIVNVNAIQKAINKNTKLISVQYINNEIGTIQPLRAIYKIAKKKGILFHVDACQAPGIVSIKNIPADLITLNGSKIYGPKGSAVLVVNNKVTLKPILFGGGQEEELVPGTLNVPAIIGFAKALEISEQKQKKNAMKLESLRSYFITRVHKNVENVFVNEHKAKQAPHIISIGCRGVLAEDIINHLGSQHIMVSAGSACTSDEVKASHVLRAIGLSSHDANSVVRISLGRNTSRKELDVVVKKLTMIVKSLRKVKL